MKALLITGVAVMSASWGVHADPKLQVQDAQLVKPAPWFLSQRRSTPDTSTPGSTAPGNPVNRRPAYVSQQEQYYAAELRRCETLGVAAERLACKNSVRNKFGEM
ncbi:MAG TPA: hypothetical protein VF460_12010 [Burkholderiales bacterium]